ncbi:hypothetical protein M9H77_29378 [Catharanthus roseus]|uniref:Uncharacterized protein n=1 Tax=Catharanthus roseus TaxID=4058 RepID=A0ACC0AJL6_CATRO|nr:hypothetical protein M9H77_29378 [Catharanthus roseus]
MEMREETQARRRKKIVEQGSDRMALITSRNHNPDGVLSPRSPSAAAYFVRLQSAPSSINAADANRFPAENRVYDRSRSTGKVQESRLSLKDDLIDGEHRDVFVLENRISSLQNTKANIAKDAPDSDTTFSCETESPIVDARISQGSNESFLKAGGRQLTSYFIPKDINSSIISSENTRVFCSIMIALLVVVSYANLPRHIVRSKSTIASRPLYVLLVTDLMIVGLRLYFTKQSLTKTAVEKPESSQGDGSNWDEAVKFLEWGLVVYQTLRAIFIDCSFYTVVVVCGFSLI